MTHDLVDLFQKLKACPGLPEKLFCLGDFIGHFSDRPSQRIQDRVFNVKALLDPVESGGSGNLQTWEKVGSASPRDQCFDPGIVRRVFWLSRHIIAPLVYILLEGDENSTNEGSAFSVIAVGVVI